MRAEHARTIEDLRADRDRGRAELDIARAEHDRATKELRAEHIAVAKVNELRTARDRGSRTQELSAPTSDR